MGQQILSPTQVLSGGRQWRPAPGGRWPSWPTGPSGRGSPTAGSQSPSVCRGWWRWRPGCSTPWPSSRTGPWWPGATAARCWPYRATPSGYTAIAAGGSHSLALRSDGNVVAWGANDHGQATVPPSLTGVTAISAGNRHSLALRADGTVVAWGTTYRGHAATGRTHRCRRHRRRIRLQHGAEVGWHLRWVGEQRPRATQRPARPHRRHRHLRRRTT